MDTNGSSAVPYLYFAAASVTNILSSRDLLTWSCYSLNAWISTNGIASVLYDGDGVPVVTNYGAGSLFPSGATNSLPFGIWVGAEPKKFFRLVTR
jgi:hypothetical protein